MVDSRNQPAETETMTGETLTVSFAVARPFVAAVGLGMQNDRLPPLPAGALARTNSVSSRPGRDLACCSTQCAKGVAVGVGVAVVTHTWFWQRPLQHCL